jgi:phenylalanyl-tRNA synthetase beta chain
MEIEFTDSSEMMNRNEDSKDLEPVYKIEVAANRYDLLSLEGLSLALRSYLYKEKYPSIKVITPANPLRLTIQASTEEVRPFVVAAVLRNIKFD